MKVEPGPNSFYRLTIAPVDVTAWLKYEVPDTHRFWDGEKQYGDPSWYLHDKYLLDAIRLAYSAVTYVDYSALPVEVQMRIAQAKQEWRAAPYEGPPLKKDTLDTAYATLHLLPSAPVAIVEAVWRKLAQIHHPDKGGDEGLFRKYNQAYKRIKGDR